MIISLLSLPRAGLAATVNGQPAATVDCNGYLEIVGSGFGATPGTLRIGGAPAPVASWSDMAIVGYVPEDAAGGLSRIETDAGAVIELDVTIAPCSAPAARALWRQRFDAPFAYARPVRGPDGTVYVLDNRHRLYAIGPGGHVRWVVDGTPVLDAPAGEPVLGNTSVAVADDGMIVSAQRGYVSALNPDGTLRWRYDVPADQRSYIVYDTKVGPDGNVYVAASHTVTGAHGVYSLTPGGALRWNVAHPYDRTTRKQIELVFGPGPRGPQLYFSANQNSYAITLADGRVVFDNLPQVTGFTAVSPDGTVHSTNYAYAPDGRIAWQSPIFLNGLMDVDGTGIHYATASLNGPRIVALNPNGSVAYEQALDLPSFTSPETTTVTPDGGRLLVDDLANRLLVLRAGNGGEEFRIELAREGVSEAYPNGFGQAWLRRPAFTADGAVAYHLAAVNTQGLIRERTFLYAVDLGGAGTVSSAPQPTPTDPAPAADVPMTVASIALSQRVRRNGVTVTARVHVVDSLERDVPDAMVAGTWTLPDGSTASAAGNTNRKGELQLKVSGSLLGVYTLAVDDVRKAGYVFDGAGGGTSASIAAGD